MVNEPTQQKATTLLQGYCVIDVLQVRFIIFLLNCSPSKELIKQLLSFG